ncbi:hypothetical protein MRX96_046748 [Rhipicephalus microplus]
MPGRPAARPPTWTLLRDLDWMNETPMGCAWLIWTLTERDPERRVWDGDLLSRRCCWLLLFPSGGKDAEWSRDDGERLLEEPL